MIRKFQIISAIIFLCSCASNQYKPDIKSLVTTQDCKIFSGTYKYENKQPDNLIDQYILKSDVVTETIDIEMGIDDVSFSSIKNGKVAFEKYFTRERSICKNSVFTIVISDEYGTGGVVTQAEGIKLEMFAYDDDSLTIRIIEEEFTMLFLVPLYSSKDKLLTLQRTQ